MSDGKQNFLKQAFGGERWVYVFLALLVAFNLVVFLGARKSSEGKESRSPAPPGPAPASPGGAPPPPGGAPPPPGGGGQPPEGAPAPPGSPAPNQSPPPPTGPGSRLSGPEMVLGIVILNEDSKHGLTSAQEKAIAEVLGRFDAPQEAQDHAAREALKWFTASQVDYMRKNRGPVEVKPGETEPGMDPVTSLAYRALVAKAEKATGTAVEGSNEAPELHFQDLVTGVLRLEEAGGALAVSAEQARALAPLVLQGSKARQEENELYDAIAEQLDPEQAKFLQENRARLQVDVDRLARSYARMSLER